MKLVYTHDGINHPLVEAEYDTAFKVYKSDRKKSVIGDPYACIEAIGLRRLHNVAFACIGSGKDAYIGFKDPNSPTGILVRHFVIPAKAGRVRDTFDTKGSPKTQQLMLNAPSAGRTIAHRRTLDKKRRTEIKAGSPVKRRGPQKNRRITKLGIAHRPRAKVVKGQVSMPTSEA